MQTHFHIQRVRIAGLIMLLVLSLPVSTWTADRPLNLAEAVMCEGVRDLAPLNPAAVFSIATGKVSCFSNFDTVPSQSYIYHHWYHRDKLSTKKKLFLKPPSWSTYSSIQLREADKGPWRVEITDDKGTLFATLRFSVTD
ncbi:MAG: DUF2914 domain-containing protein [Desulfosarcinaceae bacterium]|nr:DUF2914 domain-containing protein [Desulfosarcinaceae bacterium]